MDYPIIIVPLPEDEGGGFLGYAPDLTGCISDGATREEAAKNTENAILDWLDAAQERKLPIPTPNSAEERERARKAQLATKLKALVENVESFEERIAALEKVAMEIEEKLEHQDAWERFAELTGEVPPPGRRPRELTC